MSGELSEFELTFSRDWVARTILKESELLQNPENGWPVVEADEYDLTVWDSHEKDVVEFTFKRKAVKKEAK